MQTAIKPDFHSIKGVWEETKKQELEKKGIDPQDAAFHTLAQMELWQNLKSYIQTLKDGLDAQLTVAVDSGLSREDIGDRTIMVTLAKGLLNSIINKVEDSSEVVEEMKDDK